MSFINYHIVLLNKWNIESEYLFELDTRMILFKDSQQEKCTIVLRL